MHGAKAQNCIRSVAYANGTSKSAGFSPSRSWRTNCMGHSPSWEDGGQPYS